MGRILVVGVGNTIMADDGLGVRALRELRAHGVPEHVDTVEAGTALLDALPDLHQYDKVVLIDAVTANGDGVTVVRNASPCDSAQRPLSAHQMGIGEALRLRLLVDGKLPEIVIIGLKPKRMQFGTELSPEVTAKIPELTKAVLKEIR